MLAAGAGGAERVYAQVLGIDVHRVDLLLFRKDRHGASRGVNAPLGFCLRHALHPVRPGLELQAFEYVLAGDARDNFLVAAMFRGALGEFREAPAALLGIAAVHAEQVTREQRSFIAAGPRANFEEHIEGIVRILGQQQPFQLALGLLRLGLLLGGLFLREFPQIRIVVFKQ